MASMLAVQLAAAALLLAASAAVLRFVWLADQSTQAAEPTTVDAEKRTSVALDRAA
jgi:hypothetical protein